MDWADGVNREGGVEYEEILGYHLEQAHRYLSELGPLDERGRAIGVDASSRLALSGQRAFARGDVPAAANLLGRAVALLPENDPARLELLPDFGEALLQVGRFDEAQAVLDEAIGSSGAAGLTDRARPRRPRAAARPPAHRGRRNWQDEATAAIAEAMTVFEDAGDHAGLAKAWRLLAWTHGTSCRFGKAAEASESALQHAQLGERRAAEEPRRHRLRSSGGARPNARGGRDRALERS